MWDVIALALQWRAEQSLGQTEPDAQGVPQPQVLQWRAEQSLGQTPDVDRHLAQSLSAPSMEGRAIARPNHGAGRTMSRRKALQWRAEQSLGQTGLLGGAHGVVVVPSMEGRAIARPNFAESMKVFGVSSPFNGGPSNRSAKRPELVRPMKSLPATFNGGPSNRSAKRALLRRRSGPDGSSFNGGPSNRSAKPRPDSAGGHTSKRAFNGGPSNRSAKPRPPATPSSRRTPFNGGPSNRSAKRVGHGHGPTLAASRAFNGGPSNRSAKPVAAAGIAAGLWLLQWRAEQSLGQTAVVGVI